MSNFPTWKKFFAEGIERFRLQDRDGALNSFDQVSTNLHSLFKFSQLRQAIRIANDASYVLYDSRASVDETQNRLEDALRDAKKTIDIAPA